MNSRESTKSLLAACGGDTVKLFDVSSEATQNPCVLTHSPSPGSRVHSVKWNHNNLVLASASEDGKISLWRKNGLSLWNLPVEPSESISTISFSNKGSRYLCSGGTSQVVRIWDLQNKRCVKWLKGHTDTITGAMYNCKDEHIASVSRKGVLIVHNLGSAAKAAELRDPNGQVLGALDYSRMSRHLLVTAGDDGSIHLWDTTGRSPKASWLKQHSAPASGVSFSPSNDKVIASVGLDMKLYTFDSGSRKPSSCISYEAPFSSLAFTDDGLTLAVGTSTGQVVFYDTRGKPQPVTVLRSYGNSEAVTNLCWQRSKPVIVNENNCADDKVLLAGDLGDSVLMPDPLPSRASSLPSTASGSRHSASTALNLPSSEETPFRSSLLPRLHATRSYNIKDDMDVFSPLVEVQPITPSLNKLWDNHDGAQKNDLDRKPSYLLSSRRFGLSEDGGSDNHPILDWKSNSSSKQDDSRSTFSQLTSNSASQADDPSSITPPEAWGGERFPDKSIHHRHQPLNMPSRFSTYTSSSTSSSGTMLSASQDSLFVTSHSTNSLTSSGPNTSSNLNIREPPNIETSLPSSEAAVSTLGTTKKITGLANLDSLGTALSHPRRFSSYAERISAMPSFNEATTHLSVGSPTSKKTGPETREELFNSLLSKPEMPSSAGTGHALATNSGVSRLQKTSSDSDSQQGTTFTLQLFQRKLEETLSSFQNSIHEDMRNLHIEVLRQFHMQEMEMSKAMGLILENQAEIMREIQLLRKKIQEQDLH